MRSDDSIATFLATFVRLSGGYALQTLGLLYIICMDFLTS